MQKQNKEKYYEDSKGNIQQKKKEYYEDNKEKSLLKKDIILLQLEIF